MCADTSGKLEDDYYHFIWIKYTVIILYPNKYTIWSNPSTVKFFSYVFSKHKFGFMRVYKNFLTIFFPVLRFMCLSSICHSPGNLESSRFGPFEVFKSVRRIKMHNSPPVSPLTNWACVQMVSKCYVQAYAMHFFPRQHQVSRIRRMQFDWLRTCGGWVHFFTISMRMDFFLSVSYAPPETHGTKNQVNKPILDSTKVSRKGEVALDMRFSLCTRK